MNKRKLAVISLCIIMVFTFASCGSSDGEDTAAAPNEKHAIAYPDGIDPLESGASSYDGIDDHFDSIYFAHPDFYNMESSDTLTILTNFETYQQSTEYSCGAASAVMVMNYFDNDEYDEMTIAEMSDTSDQVGVGPDGLEKFFTEIGWDVESNASDGKDRLTPTFDDYGDGFREWAIENLKAGNPIMLDWLDWGGHWQVLIGYDTMGTEDNFGDDVIIVADPYDTTDHYQDGYMIYGAERFYYMWESHDDKDIQPWVIAKPAE